MRHVYRVVGSHAKVMDDREDRSYYYYLCECTSEPHAGWARGFWHIAVE